jgi:hypothetical protein
VLVGERPLQTRHRFAAEAGEAEEHGDGLQVFALGEKLLQTSRGYPPTLLDFNASQALSAVFRQGGEHLVGKVRALEGDGRKLRVFLAEERKGKLEVVLARFVRADVEAAPQPDASQRAER